MTNSKPLSELAAELGNLDQSKGVWFDCPVCTPTHSIYVPWSGKSPFPSGAVWQLQSAPILDVLTLAPSVNCDDGIGHGCRFHGFVQNGNVRW